MIVGYGVSVLCIYIYDRHIETGIEQRLQFTNIKEVFDIYMEWANIVFTFRRHLHSFSYFFSLVRLNFLPFSFRRVFSLHLTLSKSYFCKNIYKNVIKYLSLAGQCLSIDFRLDLALIVAIAKCWNLQVFDAINIEVKNIPWIESKLPK